MHGRFSLVITHSKSWHMKHCVYVCLCLELAHETLCVCVCLCLTDKKREPFFEKKKNSNSIFALKVS